MMRYTIKATTNSMQVARCHEYHPYRSSSHGQSKISKFALLEIVSVSRNKMWRVKLRDGSGAK